MKIFIHSFLILCILSPKVFGSVTKDDYLFRPTLQSYEAICETQKLTVSENLGDICKVVISSEVCKQVPPQDLLKCSSLTNSLAPDAWEFIKGCAVGAFTSVKEMLDFLWEIAKFGWENTTSSDARARTSDHANEYMSMMKLYLNTEYQKALARSTPPMKEVKAVASMSGVIGKMILNKITDLVVKNYHEFGCKNFEAKSKHLCKLVGDVFLPPAGIVALLKFGSKAVKDFPNLAKLFSPSKDKLAAATFKYRSEAFARLAKKNPKLEKTFNEIGRMLPFGSFPVDDVSKIPFQLTTEFRAVSPEEMLKRSKELDTATAKSIVAAYNALNDSAKLKPYMENLFTDAAEWMASKGRPQDLALLKKGVVTEQAIAVTIIKRMKERGDVAFTTINPSRNKALGFGKLEINEADLINKNTTLEQQLKRALSLINFSFKV